MRGRLADTNSAIRAKICWRSVGTNSAMQAHVCLYVCAHIFAASKPSHWQATLRNSSSARPPCWAIWARSLKRPLRNVARGAAALGARGPPLKHLQKFSETKTADDQRRLGHKHHASGDTSL